MTRAARRLAAALAALALVACRDGAAPGPSATFSGRWASRPWGGSATTFLVSGGAAGDTLYVIGRTPADPTKVATQVIRLKVAPFRGAGIYDLAPDAVEVMDLLGGDETSSLYVGRSPAAGTLDVARYDGVGEEIVGTMRFATVLSFGDPTYGQTAAFEDGQYRAVLEPVRR